MGLALLGGVPAVNEGFEVGTFIFAKTKDRESADAVDDFVCALLRQAAMTKPALILDRQRVDGLALDRDHAFENHGLAIAVEDFEILDDSFAHKAPELAGRHVAILRDG